ncbi:hypothetical protein [Curtobacterium sp. PhB78]|uniref:hypothetical protein n=1 Tax=Curtobacterium sp. PhB78 TaxID=2485102 RepID=UPI000F9E0259|nr:hypothetical protein [Curtobacterium sp. PhB78]ROS45995.1 hypothetical protein EDF53_0809 [Curtobacterium sp. PhB78]
MTMTAPDLARELRIDPKRLRAFMRRTATDHRLGNQWAIDDVLADKAREYFLK